MQSSQAMNNTSQQGAVLIMALLIVALVAGLGIKFAGDYQFGMARAEGRWYGAQARIFDMSTEAAAVKLMSKDDPGFDAPDEVWGLGFQVPLEDGVGDLAAVIEDANSYFNLNSLAGNVLDPSRNPTDPVPYTPSQRMFIRLLQTLRSPEDPQRPLVQGPAEAAGILEAVVDWMDSDNVESGLNGAETNFYLSQPQSYRPADMPFRSVEELRMVRGITPEIMKQLRKVVTVLDQEERLNINTMLPVFYRCINVSTDLTPLDESRAKSLASGMPVAGHYMQSTEVETAITNVFGASGGAAVDKEVTIKTNYFYLTTTVRMGDQNRISRSLLKRGSPVFTVMRREDVYGY